MISTRKPLTINKLREDKKYRWVIGIDPGVNTGFAVWDSRLKKLVYMRVLSIHKIMSEINLYNELDHNFFVRIEDARKRTWFGKSGREQLQGAGSIKRDCKIWEDFLTDLGIDFEMVAPKNNKTKLDAKRFKQITKWEGATNEHSRDAAMLCFGFT